MASRRGSLDSRGGGAPSIVPSPREGIRGPPRVGREPAGADRRWSTRGDAPRMDPVGEQGLAEAHRQIALPEVGLPEGVLVGEGRDPLLGQEPTAPGDGEAHEVRIEAGVRSLPELEADSAHGQVVGGRPRSKLAGIHRRLEEGKLRLGEVRHGSLGRARAGAPRRHRREQREDWVKAPPNSAAGADGGHPTGSGTSRRLALSKAESPAAI